MERETDIRWRHEVIEVRTYIDKINPSPPPLPATKQVMYSYKQHISEGKD